MALHVLVLAGGSGTRLWPLSRRALPKHLLPLGRDGVSLLRATVERVLPLTEHVHVVTTAAQAAGCREALAGIPGPAVSMIVEPLARGTGPALGLATAWIGRSDPDAVVCSVHADHHVGDEDAYRAALQAAAGWAFCTGGLATVGVWPTHAATGFGYITMGRQLPPGEWRPPPDGRAPSAVAEAAAGLPAHEVTGFVEKPSHEVAQHLVGDNRHLWNLGLFAWPRAAFATELERVDPAMAAAVEDAVVARAAGEEAAVAGAYGRIPVAAVEPLIMERTARLSVVRASFGWSDLGSWPDLHEARLALGEGDEMGNVADGDGVTLDSRNCLVSARGGRTVAVVGGEGLIVVDTGDAVLVVPAGQAQRVRDLACRLAALGHPELR